MHCVSKNMCVCRLGEEETETERETEEAHEVV